MKTGVVNVEQILFCVLTPKEPRSGSVGGITINRIAMARIASQSHFAALLSLPSLTVCTFGRFN